MSPSDVVVSSLPRVALTERHILPADAGIYFAMKGDEILYIGMATSLLSRWKGYHRYTHMWTRSYLCSTAGNVSAATIQRYIAEQTARD